MISSYYYFFFSDAHALFACDDKGLRTEVHAPEAVKEPFILEQRVRDLLQGRSLQ